jgi:proteasome accessory factor B
MTDDVDAPDGERLEGKRDRLARLLSVLRVLHAHGEGGVTPREIARRTGMSPRTVYRDLNALQNEMQVPLWSEGGKWGVQPGAFLPAMRLTLQEAMAVFLAARLMTRYTDRFDPSLASAFSKLEEGLPDAMHGHVERTLDEMAGRRTDEAYNRRVEDLTRAWAEQRVVRFQYVPAGYDGDREPEWREVRPYLLEPSLETHALYLIGFDEGRDALRTFKVERILDLSLTPRRFEAPAEEALATALRPAWDIIWDQPTTEVVLPVRAVGGRARRRGGVAPVAEGQGVARRGARVARQGGWHRRDPALDPVVGRGRGGACTDRPARRRGGQPRACGGPLRALIRGLG